jgi:hypothetical protein
MPLKFNTANGAIIVSAEDGSGDAAVTFPRSGYVEPTHTGNVNITGDLTTTGAVGITGDVTTTGAFDHTGDLDVDGVATFVASNEGLNGLGTLSSSATIDLSTGNVFTGTISSNTTISFINFNANSDRNTSFTLRLYMSGAYTITWPSQVNWSGGTAPDAPATGEVDVFVFFNVGALNWYGFQAGNAMS